MMNKYIVIIRNIVCLTCLIFFLGGCEKPAENPPAPQVRQKIAVQEETPQPPQKGEPGQTEAVKASPGAAPGQSVSPPKPGSKAQPETMAIESATDEDKIPKPFEIAAVSPGPLKGGEIVKVDPFMPLFKEEKPLPPKQVDTGKKETKKRVPLTPLEKIDLSQLKLVGIVRSSGGERALVEEASGKGYIVTKGTYIGINSGKIIEITEDGLVIEEEIEDALGKVTINKTELKLQKPPGEF